MTLAGSAHQTAAQRGGEAKDKDKPLSDMQRDRYGTILLRRHLSTHKHSRLVHDLPGHTVYKGSCCSKQLLQQACCLMSA